MLRDKKDLPKEIGEKLNQYDFQILDMIDPSFFENNANILETIVGKMFKRFNDEMKTSNCNRNNNDDYTNKKNLIDKFATVQNNFKSLINIKKDQSFGDSLEALESLADGAELKKSIQDLFTCYIQFFCNTKEKKSYIVIPIDDIDINTRHAYIMVEQIRKYFIMPNIIILISLKIDQLSLVIKKELAQEFKDIDAKKWKALDYEEMADRYLEKLLPQAYRIYLPDMSASLNEELKILPNKDVNPDDYPSYHSIAHAVTEFIFQKTRFLFYHMQGTVSYIVPRNLRELRHIIYQLCKMPNYKKKEDGGNTEYNKHAFKQYFFETWVENNLDDDGRKIVQEILKITDATLMNKTVISELLKKRFKDLLSYSKESKEELNYIINQQNVAYNISIGDVIAIIDYIEERCPSDSDKKLLFFIRSLYSIKLYEYYDEMTELKKDKMKKTHSQSTIPVLPAETIFEGVNNLEKLVGGNYINSKIVNLIQDERGGENKRRSFRRMNIAILTEWLNVLVNVKELIEEKNLSEKEYQKKIKEIDEWYLKEKKLIKNDDEEVEYNEKKELKKKKYEETENCKTDYSNNLDNIEKRIKTSVEDNNNLDTVNINKLNLVEFFALTSSRIFIKKDGRYNERYREYNNLYYTEKFYEDEKDKDMTEIYFDLASLFFNMLDVEKAYNRIDESLYSWAKYHPESLYNKIKNMEEVKDRDRENCKDHGFLSFVTIRNAEVLKVFSTFIEHEKRKSGSSADFKIIFRDFFQRVFDFEIKTYDRNENGYPYDINFTFSSVIKNLFDDIEEVYIKGVLERENTEEISSIDLTSIDITKRIITNKKHMQSKKIREKIYNIYSRLQPAIKDIIDKKILNTEKSIPNDETKIMLEELENEINDYISSQQNSEASPDDNSSQGDQT
jgi:hypothetical protein